MNSTAMTEIGQGRLTNDALIAMSAARLGITVITANARDFLRLAEYVRFNGKSTILAAANAIPTFRCRK
jgi:hypothetical protein